MKKTITSKNDWKKTMNESTDNILKSVDSLIAVLQKNRKAINKDVKSYGANASGVNELFEKLTRGLDTKISEVWDVIDES